MTTPPGPKPGPAPSPKPGPRPATPQPDVPASQSGPSPHKSQSKNHNESREREPHPHERAHEEAVAAYPYVALTIQTTNIHPSTGRLLTVDALTFSESGEVGQEFHAVLNPETDPGPRHLHGLSAEDIAQGQLFSKLLKPLDRLIDGRSLVVHNTAFTWGFIVSEARRAMMAAARQNRARGRNRAKGRRRRHKVGHVPTPVAIIDTLATSRRQGVWSTDVRLGGVAKRSGVTSHGPEATVERAQQPEAFSSRAQTSLLVELFRHQQAGPLSSYAPEDLRADRFGLQRSHVRVDAAEAPRQHHNPGKYEPGKELRRGMEIVIAPEITEDPDVIIEALMREELNYSEKLTRETSLVVCNVTTDLVGKPMHAHRKGIPLMSDTAFLAALTRIEDAVEEDPSPAGPASTAHVPNSNNRHSSNANRRRTRRKSSPSSASTGASAGSHGEAHKDHSSAEPSQDKHSGNSKRRRRRGGRGGRGRRTSGANRTNSAGNNPSKNQGNRGASGNPGNGNSSS